MMLTDNVTQGDSGYTVGDWVPSPTWPSYPTTPLPTYQPGTVTFWTNVPHFPTMVEIAQSKAWEAIAAYYEALTAQLKASDGEREQEQEGSA